MGDGSIIIDVLLNDKILKKGIKGLGATVAGVTAAFGAMTKASLDSVASLEQNVGGVETLFKDNAKTVIANANKAYKTAGMSANQYMQSVTSFSASLLQSVSGDTKEAARVADMAMVDMSDNANKMGTDMASIQNAYQGFAKQNYTMLDNLKLGYGGTKTEMQRLLSDATKLTGVKYDINNLNDVYEAIHAVQENIGITGTTAKEASTTIEGSVNAAKAAYDNLLNGSGSAKELADAAATAITNIGKNLMEIIPRLAQTVPEMFSILYGQVQGSIGQFIQIGTDIVVNIAIGILNYIPSVINAGLSLIASLSNSIVSQAPRIISVANTLISKFILGIANALPKILASGIQIVGKLANGIVSSLPQIVTGAGNLITKFTTKIISSLPKILDTGVKVVLSVANGIIKNLPNIASAAAKVIVKFVSSVTSKLPQILSTGIKLLGKLAAGIIKAIPSLVAKIPQVIKAIIKEFTKTNWLDVGKNIVKGIAKGIVGAAGEIVSAAKEAAKRALDAAKNALGIHSPSTKFRDIVGKNIPRGIVAGIKAEQKKVQKTVESLCSSLVKASSRANGNYEKIGNDYVKKLSDGINAKANASIKSVKNLVDKNIKALGKSNKKAKAEYTKAGKAVIDAYSQAVKAESKELISSIEKSLDEASKAAQEKYNEIIQKQSDMRDKIAGYGDTYTDGRGLFLVGDLQKNVDDIKTYQQNLSRLKGNIPESLMNEILGMDIGEANKYIAALNNLTSDAYDKYISLWNEQQALSKTISQQYYQNDIAAVKSSYEAQIAQIAQSATTSASSIGTDISGSFASALKKESKNMSKTAKKVTDTIAKQMNKDMKSVGSNIASGLVSGLKLQNTALVKSVTKSMNDVVKAAKKTLKIKSPSRVFDEIGRFSIKGAEQGTEKEGKNLIRQSGNLAEKFSEQFSKAKFNAGSMVEKMKRAVMAERSNMTLAVAGGATYNMSNTPQIDWSNAPTPQFSGTIHTHVNLDSREVGNGVTPVVSENMAFRKGRLR